MTKNEVLREFLSIFGEIPASGVSTDNWEAVFTVNFQPLKKLGHFCKLQT